MFDLVCVLCAMGTQLDGPPVFIFSPLWFCFLGVAALMVLLYVACITGLFLCLVHVWEVGAVEQSSNGSSYDLNDRYAIHR